MGKDSFAFSTTNSPSHSSVRFQTLVCLTHCFSDFDKFNAESIFHSKVADPTSNNRFVSIFRLLYNLRMSKKEPQKTSSTGEKLHIGAAGALIGALVAGAALVFSEDDSKSAVAVPEKPSTSKHYEEPTTNVLDDNVRHKLGGLQLMISQALCCVCLERPKRVLLMPCKHLCACQHCADSIASCPICRELISDRIVAHI